MRTLRLVASLAILASLAVAGCGGGNSAGSGNLTRTSLVSCLTKAGVSAKKTPEAGFSPPGGALLVGPDGTGFIVGVFPDQTYAQAQANSVVTIAAAYVGKPDAQKNVHVIGNTVWFPQHSPFTGQHLHALDTCLSTTD